MILLKRSRAPSRIHGHYTGELLVEKLMKLVQARIDSGDDLDFEKALGDWKKNKPNLKKDTKGKCGYCEADTEVVAYGDVEHFRPKTDYWWLALCVDNFVFSCQICNQTYKKTNFPVAGRRLPAPRMPAKVPRSAVARSALAATLCPDPAAVTDQVVANLWDPEDSDLPHPYLEDPEPLFEWHEVVANEEVHLVLPTSGDPRALRAYNAAEQYLGLNRETLLRARYQVFASLRSHIEHWRSGSPASRTLAAKDIRRMCADKSQFAGMCRFFARRAGFAI